MASLIYNSCLDDALRAIIDFDDDDFAVMLCTSAYAANKDTHTKRSDVTNEVVGASYDEGGLAATVTVTKDIANDRIDIELGAASWPAATITAAYAVYYKSRGGAASADELIAVIDFGGNIVSTNGTFSLTASTLRIQN